MRRRWEKTGKQYQYCVVSVSIEESQDIIEAQGRPPPPHQRGVWGPWNILEDIKDPKEI